MDRPEGLLAAATVLITLATSAGGASAGPWPSLLGSRDAFSPEVSAAVERVWREPTLSRTVNGPPAHVPFEVYVALVDAPEVTAAAARFRRLANYEVQALDDDHYRANDGDGARGLYQVLRREPRRRVVFSQGEHAGPMLGTIKGSALTVLDIEPRGDAVDPTLTAYVYIDDPVAAGLAQLLIVIFGFLADRKPAEGLRVTAGVAEWAVDRSGGFCEWLAREQLPPARRNRILAALPSCAAGLLELRELPPPQTHLEIVGPRVFRWVTACCGAKWRFGRYAHRIYISAAG